MTKFNYLVVLLTFFFCIEINALENISINNEQLSPIFDENTSVYNYYTNKDNIKITVSKSSDEVVKGYGLFNIKDGLNEFVVTSTIKNKEYKYKINVFKNYNKDNDSLATFKSLTIENYNIDFKNDVYDYYIDIDNEPYLNIKYELDNSSSIVEIKNNGNFINEKNDVIISIKSKDGNNSNKYTIHVNRTIPVFKSEKQEKELSHTQKEIAKLLIISISCSLIVYVFYLLFVKKII